ncbi:uncharacterized protein LOC119334205 [Triticum dicoccoides]|uniref:uncharacterized protein LOC119334205 n=1 Tax=Triticum dicoccoides TaxID=85692 RepID=UPI00162E5713|nr:uncharacterized protein LOC119334205 [Triticum dicoccoides]
MRREGRQRGWVRVYDRDLVDPDGKRRAAHVVDADGQAVVVANGGYVRASRRPTNHSKPGGGRALDARCRKALRALEEEEEEAPPPQPAARYGYSPGWWPPSSPSGYGAVAQAQPAPARSGGKASSKAGRNFKHGKISKTYYLDEDEIDYLYNYDS